MQTKRTSVALAVCMLHTAILAGVIGLAGESRATPTDWVEEWIKDAPTTVWSVAVGDADNDGENEVVMGLNSGTNELRSFKKVGSLWTEDIIADLPETVRCIAIGNADSDMANEIVIGMWTTTNEVRAYEYVDGTWVEEIIADLPVYVSSIAIGNPDDDPQPEVVVGLGQTTNEIRAYQKVGVVWNEDLVADTPDFVNSIAVGDADNDGDEEIVAALGGNSPPMTFISDEVRMYDMVSGAWTQTVIADLQNDALSVAIGDISNNGTNEVAITHGWAFGGSTYEVRSYMNISGTWGGELISDPPGNDIGELSIGDPDNDGLNEIVANFVPFISSTGYVKSYKRIGGSWTEETIVTALPGLPAQTVVGDADNDGENEVVVGLASSIGELRMYSKERGGILFTSHYDGQYVTGTACFEVTVTSSHVYAVRFLLNGSQVFTDSSPPYQLILNTSTLTEDASYVLRVEGLRRNALPLNATLGFVVNNVLQVGDYITVGTLKNSYEPDEELSVVVGTKSPPPYSLVNIVVSYFDPAGNAFTSEGRIVPPNPLFLLNAPLYSDALLGTYDLRVDVYGFVGSSLVWYATNATTFTVTGKSLHERIADLDLNISLGNITDMIDGLNASLSGRIAGMETNILNAIAVVNASLALDIQNMLASVTNEIAAMNSSLSKQLTDLLNNVTSNNSALLNWLQVVLGTIDRNLTATNNTLQARLTTLETTMASFYGTLRADISNILVALQSHDAVTGENHTAIKNMINTLIGSIIGQSDLDELKNMLTTLSLDLASHNAALTNNILNVINLINSFETSVDQQLNDIDITLAQLQKLNDILAVLDALDLSIEQAKDELASSVVDASNAEIAKIDGQIVLLSVIIILIVISIMMNVLVMLQTRRGGERANLDEISEEEEEEEEEFEDLLEEE